MEKMTKNIGLKRNEKRKAEDNEERRYNREAN
jgi:hypothetical protein